jgi:hypothetical protein
MIWGTYMKLVTKYQISAINSCWEKCAYMFNMDKNQLSRQTGSRNLMVPKTLPTIWHTYVEKKLFQHFANLIKIRSTRLLPILDLIIPPVPEGGGGYTVKLKLNSLRGKLIKKNCKTKMVLPYTNKKRNKTVVIRKSHKKIFPSKIRLFLFL